ncbi:MAG: sulfatase family protein, partial [Candidatus Cyclobacteriaceae bacterium M3_2C_046]
MKNNTINTFIFVLLSLLWAACNPSQPKEDLPPPNILWITSEDNSPFLGAYGDEFATTPVLDSLASVGVLYENAFAAAPVCAPTRNTIITGMYANSLGTENMRSNYPIPDFVKFYPTFLQEAGYYVTNNVKKDYNTIDQPEAWNESSNEASYRNRKPGQPFFHIRNFTRSHESSIHDSIPMDQLVHDPETVPIPAYHPRTPEMKHDWAQYYDRITQLDTMVGQVLQELKADGLADSTIIFYYSDHGGILGRSKRFMFESGLRVPLIIYFPEMYRHLAPAQPGSKTDRIVTFVDFAPTLLSLAGVPIPEHMQGKPFLGEQQTAPRDYGYNFRGRMDERFDLVRSVRDKEFRYIRNYMPHKIYGQHIAYLWRAPSMRSWEREYKKGNLNEIQSKFWGPKPVEELYDIKADPDNINNLADDPEYQE